MNHLFSKLSAIAVVVATSASASALSLSSGDALGVVIPGTPSGDSFAEEQVRFLAVGHNANNDGGPAGVNIDLGDNLADSNTETYTLLRTYADELNTSISFFGKNDNGNTTFNFGAGITFEYVLAAYGNDSMIWYIGDLDQDGTWTLPGSVGLQGSLSHTTFFNATGSRVPDAGATAVLLGLGVLGLAAIRRK